MRSPKQEIVDNVVAAQIFVGQLKGIFDNGLNSTVSQLINNTESALAAINLASMQMQPEFIEIQVYKGKSKVQIEMMIRLADIDKIEYDNTLKHMMLYLKTYEKYKLINVDDVRQALTK